MASKGAELEASKRKEARRAMHEITPGEGWWKSATPRAIEDALAHSSRASWPWILAAVESMRGEFGD